MAIEMYYNPEFDSWWVNKSAKNAIVKGISGIFSYASIVRIKPAFASFGE